MDRSKQYCRLWQGSGSLAKKRLHTVLMSDKTDCTPEMLDQIKEEMLSVISRYMTTDREKAEFFISGHDPVSCLCASFPILDIQNRGIYS